MTKLLQTAVPVGRALLARADEDGTLITPLQVIKLAYIAHGWHLAITGQPLTNEAVLAWKYGPVFRSIYDRYRRFGDSPIRDNSNRKPVLPTQTNEIIDSVWENYSHLDGGKLINLTHARGTPWNDVFQECGQQLPLGQTISNESIERHFRDLARANDPS